MVPATDPRTVVDDATTINRQRKMELTHRYRLAGGYEGGFQRLPGRFPFLDGISPSRLRTHPGILSDGEAICFSGRAWRLHIWPGMGIEESPGEHFVYPLFCSDDTFWLVSIPALRHGFGSRARRRSADPPTPDSVADRLVTISMFPTRSSIRDIYTFLIPFAHSPSFRTAT